MLRCQNWFGYDLLMEVSLSLVNKTALVTGGSRGIGRAIATKLAQHGANVIINYFNSESAAYDLAGELQEKYKVNTLCVKANVASKESVAEMFEEIKKSFSELNILISNAASGVLKPVLEMRAKHFNHCIWRSYKDTNTFKRSYLIRKWSSKLHKLITFNN